MRLRGVHHQIGEDHVLDRLDRLAAGVAHQCAGHEILEIIVLAGERRELHGSHTIRRPGQASAAKREPGPMNTDGARDDTPVFMDSGARAVRSAGTTRLSALSTVGPAMT